MGALMMTACDTAHAQIVALGASNTAGWRVGSDAAWPARLEALLHGRGYHVNVSNAGISGDTTDGMLARLDSAVPSGTRVVVYAIYMRNDARHGVSAEQHAANIRLILSRLHSRGVRTIDASHIHGLPLQGDGIHLTAEGHAQFAARIMPQVVAALGSARH
jgi:acyl-CoA thioesterase I